MKIKYFITYDTLKNNISNDDNILFKYKIEYYLISNYPKIRYFKLWKWCFFRGIIPNKFYFGKKIFRKNLYAIKDVIESIENKNEILFITDYDVDIDLLRGIKNLKICNFETFKKIIEIEEKRKIKPFN